MTTQQAQLTIPAPAAAVREILLTPLDLPGWNSAFLSIEGPAAPAVDTRYALRVRPAFKGTLVYAVITDDRVDLNWQVPGLHETGSWTLEDHGSSTVVRHTFTHTGPLARVLRQAFQGVAALRLGRLAARVR